MDRMHVLSFPNSVKMSDEILKRDCATNIIANTLFGGLKDEAIDTINELLYKTAKERGCSLYDLCFKTVPQVGDAQIEETPDGKTRFVTKVKLTPIKFDFTHDGDYWRKKYFNLKARMQELINQKDDEND